MSPEVARRHQIAWCQDAVRRLSGGACCAYLRDSLGGMFFGSLISLSSAELRKGTIYSLASPYAARLRACLARPLPLPWQPTVSHLSSPSKAFRLHGLDIGTGPVMLTPGSKWSSNLLPIPVPDQHQRHQLSHFRSHHWFWRQRCFDSKLDRILRKLDSLQHWWRMPHRWTIQGIQLERRPRINPD